jgi:DNA-binding NarL/FixJ family response regulator
MGPTKKPDPKTPLTETLDDWTFKYELTPAEREVLFATATGSATHAELARMRETTPDTVKAQSSDVCKKVGARSLLDASLRLFREAYALAESDREMRDAKREKLGEDEDDHG